jgi:type IV pilus assembly protein PilO
LVAAQKKLTEAEDFFKNFEALKARIRQLATELEESKAILSTQIDLANFVRMLSLEAKKIGLTLKGIRPEQEKKREYYVEVPFSVSLKGAYVQALVFFDRIAKLHQVIHVTDFSIKPSGNVFTKYVELDGSVRLAAFKYLGSEADAIGSKPELSTKVDVNNLGGAPKSENKGGGK